MELELSVVAVTTEANVLYVQNELHRVLMEQNAPDPFHLGKLLTYNRKNAV